MVISRHALKTTGHARRVGVMRCSTARELHRKEQAVLRKPMMNSSVVTIRLLTRATYCGTTTNRCWHPSGHFEESNVLTRNELCWYIPGFPVKQGTAQLFTLCVFPGPGTMVPVNSTFGPHDMRESQIRFSERDNNRNWVSYYQMYKSWVSRRVPLLMFKISSTPSPMLPPMASDVGIHILG